MKDGEKMKTKKKLQSPFIQCLKKKKMYYNQCVCMCTYTQKKDTAQKTTRTKEESSLLLLIGLCGDKWETKRRL